MPYIEKIGLTSNDHSSYLQCVVPYQEELEGEEAFHIGDSCFCLVVYSRHTRRIC